MLVLAVMLVSLQAMASITGTTTVSAASVQVGQNETVTVTLKSTAAIASSTVRILLFQGTTRIPNYGKYFEKTAFVANQNSSFTYTFNTNNLAAGNYTVEVGVWSDDWATTYYYKSGASAFSVTSATSVIPKPSASTLISADSVLNTGPATTVTNQQVAIIKSSKIPSEAAWVIFANPWGINGGTGQSSVTYGGNSTVSMKVKYANLNQAGVNGYPFIGVGRDSEGYQNGGTVAGYPKFPARLDSMKSLVLETNHTLTLRAKPGNLDIAYDQWLVPSPTYSGGQSGAVEVLIAYYYNFQWPADCPLVKTMSVPMEVNGALKYINFKELRCLKPEWNNAYFVVFIPASPADNMASGNIRFDMLPLLTEAARATSIGNTWYVSGVFFGTEFGHAPGPSGNYVNDDYQLDIKKLRIEQTPK